MIKIKLIFGGCALAILCSCGSSGGGGGGSPAAPNDQPDVSIPSVSNHMKFDSSVSSDKAAALNEAISVVHFIDLSSTDGRSLPMMEWMKIRKSDPATLHSWLEERVSYIVDQNYDLDSHASLVGNRVNYPEPDVIPDAIKALRPQVSRPSSEADSSVQTIMLNIGGGIYFAGKQQKRIVQVQLDGIGKIDLTTPRIGLLEIGPGMFIDLGQPVQNMMMAIFRAGILFHEARHSDGHGLTLGFMHAKCPPEITDYAGMNACDAAINGPYNIGADMMLNLRNACGANCTELTMSFLRSMFFDQAGRVLDSEQLPDASEGALAGTEWDDAPEMVRQR